MKKPKRLTADELNAVVSKRKHKVITVNEKMPSGRLVDVIDGVKTFATEQGVGYDEVKINNNGYYGGYMSVRRQETDAEKFKRVKADQDYLYQDRVYKYDQWQREQNRLAARTIVKCCKKCSCGCC